MTMPRRGEIWQYRFKAPDKRRPVVILTRQEVLPLPRTRTCGWMYIEFGGDGS